MDRQDKNGTVISDSFSNYFKGMKKQNERGSSCIEIKNQWVTSLS